jgi:hypothetical protein
VWSDAFGAGLEAGAFQETLDAYPALQLPLSAAAAVAGRVVEIPGAALLSGSLPLEARVRLAARLANPDARGTAQQLSSDSWLGDWLLTPPAADAIASGGK